MPSRVIRGDELLESERYMAQSPAVQAFYIHTLCAADDFGLCLMTPTFIRRRFFLRAPGDSKIEHLIQAAVSADLIRLYEFEGARFAFVPRFRQRLKNFRCKHPMPPPELFADDKDASENFLKYKHLFKKTATSSGESATSGGDGRPDLISSRRDSDLDLDLDLDLESISNEGVSKVPLPLVAGASGDAARAKPVLKSGKQPLKSPYAYALKHGITQREGESIGEYLARISLHMDQNQNARIAA